MIIIKCSKSIINYAFSANAALYAVFSNLADCFRSTQNNTSCVALLLSIMILGWGKKGESAGQNAEGQEKQDYCISSNKN